MPDDDPLDGLPLYLRAAKVAAILDVGEQLLSDWRKARVGPPYVKLTEGRSGAVRYPREGLREYIKSHTVDPKTYDPEAHCSKCGAVGLTSYHVCTEVVA